MDYNVKKCTKCLRVLELSYFSPQLGGKLGVATRCKECRRATAAEKRAEDPDRAREQSRRWARENPEASKAIKDRWDLRNPTKVADRKRRWLKKNSAKCLSSTLAWQQANPGAYAASRRKSRDKARQDPFHRLNNSIRAGVYASLARGEKSASTFDLLAYTLDDLKCHLEARFQPGMTWDNYGPVWHVDHVIPLSAHNFEKPTDIDFHRAWRLDNLSPLWAVDNIRKSAKLTAPFQPSLALG